MTIKLSDAIWMGDSLKKPDAFEWLSRDGSCGCAFGGALLAAGITPEQFHAKYYDNGYYGFRQVAEAEFTRRLWPWIKPEHINSISYQYCKVYRGAMTLEQLCDYVRSIEPAEPEGDYEDEGEYWTDSKGMAEMVNSIKGR